MPRRRRFRYNTLLRVRERQEELKAAALVATRQRRRAAERERAELAAEQLAALRAAGVKARQRFEAAEVRRYYQYERHLAELVDRKDADIVAVHEEEETCRAELEEATKQKRIVERLKERQHAAMLADLNKEEQGFSDEVSLNQAAMTRMGRHRS